MPFGACLRVCAGRCRDLSNDMSNDMSLVSTRKFHACNAHVDVYSDPCLHESFFSCEKEICVTMYTREDERDVLLVWMLPYATRISSTTTKQLCRYLGERIQHYVSINTTKSGRLSERQGYMPVSAVRMLIALGTIGDDYGVYARYMGPLSKATPDALRAVYYG